MLGRLGRSMLCFAALMLSLMSYAEQMPKQKSGAAVRQLATPQSAPQKLQATVKLHTADELRSLLQRAEQIANGESKYNIQEPVALVLHGAEIDIFRRKNYRDNKSLVDLAARLDAFNIVDLKVCERWMGENGVLQSDIPPFLETVPFGPDEVKRLSKAGYGNL